MIFDNLKLNFNFRNRNLTWNPQKFSLLIGETDSRIGELVDFISNQMKSKSSDVFNYHSASFVDWGNIKNSLIIIQNIESGLDPNSIRKLIRAIDKVINDNNLLRHIRQSC